RAEQLELENGLEVAQTRRCRRLDSEPALSDSGKRTVVLPELVPEGRQLRHAQGFEPGRWVLLEVMPHVQHREAVDLHRRLRFLRRLLGSSGRSPETGQK